MGDLANHDGVEPVARDLADVEVCPTCGHRLDRRPREPFVPDPQTAQVWTDICHALEKRLEPHKFGIWVQPLTLAYLDADRAVLLAPDHLRSWVRDRYAPLIQAELRVALGAEPVVTVESLDWRPDERT